MKWKLMIGAVAAAALAAAGGIAYAAATGSDSVVDACAKSDGGQLRLDGGSGCLPSETAVQLGSPNVAVERTFFRGFTDPIDNWQPISSTKPGTQLTTAHLTQGDWVVQAQVLGGDYDGRGVLVCIAGNNALGGFTVGQGSIGGDVQQLNLDFQSTFVVPAAGGDVNLSCWLAPDPGDPASAGHPLVGLGDILATKVDSLG